jgi:hypothetical protein
MMRGIILCVVIVVFVLSGAAVCGVNKAAKVAIHVRDHDAKAGCKASIASCSDIVTTTPGFNVDAFPVFFNLTEYRGCAYSLTWPDWTYSAVFTSCSDLVIGEITLPGPAQYAAHAWKECRTGVCVPGFVWLYADGPGKVCVIEPGDSLLGLSVLDCTEGLDAPIQSFCAGVYGAEGDDPCSEPGGEAQDKR